MIIRDLLEIFSTFIGKRIAKSDKMCELFHELGGFLFLKHRPVV